MATPTPKISKQNGRNKKERKKEGKKTIVTNKLHTEQCSYNTDSDGWLKLHCHKNTNIPNFNSVAKRRDTLNQVKKT